MLAWNVALPFGILASSSPLIQAWFARSQPERSPYPLYAVSNLGSFLALLAFPFWIEPRFAVSQTSDFWTFGFASASAMILFCAYLARNEDPSERVKAPSVRPPFREVALWGSLSGTAVAVFMGVTNKLTLDVASVPFLWVIPLALYLVTFVIAFASQKFYRRSVFVLFMAALGLLSQSPWISGAFYDQVLLYCGTLFGACMILHGELYRRRPATASLTVFYLSISAGGALAGLFIGLVAPQVFDDYYELPLGLGATWALLLIASRGDSRSWIGDATPPWRLRVTLAATFVAWVGIGIFFQSAGSEDRIHQERTFFGVLEVHETATPAQRQLRHGTTLHGAQPLDPAHRQTPTSYYGRRTPIGVLMQNRERGESINIGVIGMGIGTLAAYGRPEDSFRFYEIDPAVVKLALEPRFFDVVANSPASIEIVEADGRLALETELKGDEKPNFDILVLDAFSGDAVPLHLLTREALEIYRQAIAPDGVLAFHISNRYMRLSSAIARSAASAGMGNLVAGNPNLPEDKSAFSRWIFTSRSRDRMHSLAEILRQEALLPVPEGEVPMFVRSIGRTRQVSTPLWTDDYTDLRGAIAFPARFATWLDFLQPPVPQKARQKLP